MWLLAWGALDETNTRPHPADGPPRVCRAVCGRNVGANVLCLPVRMTIVLASQSSEHLSGRPDGPDQVSEPHLQRLGLGPVGPGWGAAVERDSAFRPGGPEVSRGQGNLRGP